MESVFCDPTLSDMHECLELAFCMYQDRQLLTDLTILLSCRAVTTRRLGKTYLCSGSPQGKVSTVPRKQSCPENKSPSRLLSLSKQPSACSQLPASIILLSEGGPHHQQLQPRSGGGKECRMRCAESEGASCIATDMHRRPLMVWDPASHQERKAITELQGWGLELSMYMPPRRRILDTSLAFYIVIGVYLLRWRNRTCFIQQFVSLINNFKIL